MLMAERDDDYIGLMYHFTDEWRLAAAAAWSGGGTAAAAAVARSKKEMAILLYL